MEYRLSSDYKEIDVFLRKLDNFKSVVKKLEKYAQ